MSPFWILLGLRMMEVAATTGSVRFSQIKSSPPTNQHPTFYRPDELLHNQQCQSTEGKDTQTTARKILFRM